MEEFFKIGQIVKPQGIRGEVKVIPMTDDPNRFKKLKKVFIDGKEVAIGGVKVACDCVILSIAGVSDRNMAELMRGKFLSVKRKDAVDLAEGSYFIADIVGSSLNDESGNKIGEILEVTSAKTDYFTVKTLDDKIMRFPFLKRVVISFSAEEKIMVCDSKKLAEVSVYED